MYPWIILKIEFANNLSSQYIKTEQFYKYFSFKIQLTPAKPRYGNIPIFQTSDAGGSILTHAFGAFFGLGLTLGLGVKPKHIPEENRLTNYVSDTFSLVGTIVLWMFWPSFNGG